MPESMKTLLRQRPNRMNGKTGMIALMNRPYTKTRRTVIIFRESLSDEDFIVPEEPLEARSLKGA